MTKAVKAIVAAGVQARVEIDLVARKIVIVTANSAEPIGNNEWDTDL